MVKEHPCVSATTKAAPGWFLALAATAAVLSLWIPVAGAGAAAEQQQQQRILFGNTTTSFNHIVDGGDLRIAHAQPQLEGFDQMSSDLGSARRVLGQLTLNIGEATKIRGKAECGRGGRDRRYFSCTTEPSLKAIRKCDPLSRDCGRK